MTCIAAVKKGGKVVIGGDSLLTTGSDKKSGVRKITKFPGCYVGFAGMYAIRHSLDNLARDEDFLSTFKMDCIEDARDLARKVFEELQDELGGEASEDIEDTALIICTSNKIFEVDSDITCVEHDDYTSIGSGARVAKAVIEVLNKHYPLTPIRECVTIALDTASHLDLMCGAPYYIYEVEDEPDSPKPSRGRPKSTKPKTPRAPNPRSGEGLRNISRMPESDSSASPPRKSRSKPKVPKRSTK